MREKGTICGLPTRALEREHDASELMEAELKEWRSDPERPHSRVGKGNPASQAITGERAGWVSGKSKKDTAVQVGAPKMRTIRNLVGVVFVVAVLVGSQARVDAYVDCPYSNAECNWSGHWDYAVGCEFQGEQYDCNDMQWDAWSWCASLAGGLSYYVDFSCIGDDNPYGLAPTSGTFACYWHSADPC
jgi:hypothetical protein